MGFEEGARHTANVGAALATELRLGGFICCRKGGEACQPACSCEGHFSKAIFSSGYNFKRSLQCHRIGSDENHGVTRLMAGAGLAFARSSVYHKCNRCKNEGSGAGSKPDCHPRREPRALARFEGRGLRWSSSPADWSEGALPDLFFKIMPAQPLGPPSPCGFANALARASRTRSAGDDREGMPPSIGNGSNGNFGGGGEPPLYFRRFEWELCSAAGRGASVSLKTKINIMWFSC